MTLSKEDNIANLTPIQQFYANSKIFITGGTGFLGTILVEKLLRSCLNIHTIYLLIRSKKGVNPDVRLLHYFDDIVFDKMKKENPNYRNQVKCIHGDISEDGLGLNEIDRNTILDEVNIVFHGAATVNFKEKLQNAIFINIKGTLEVLTLSKNMKNLKFITHVSTTYVHCDKTVLAEKFYKPAYTANEMLTIAKNTSAENMDKLTNVFLENFPNTYSFTKTVSEELVEQCDNIPIAIFRPAIILSSLKEPIPGWLNNFYGPTWATIAGMVGLLRSLRCDSNVGSNIVPVDMCTNTLIAIPWQCRHEYETEIRTKQSYIIRIYNYETNSYQNLTWNKFRKLSEHYIDLYPSLKMIGECFQIMTKSYTIHIIVVVLFHYFPALIIDGVSKCLGKKSNLLKQYKLIDKLNKTFSYFLNRHWNYKSENLIKLCDSMSQKDQEIFFCDLRKLDWNQYFKTYILGCRKYLLKDDLSTIPFAKKRQFCIKFITRSMLLLVSYIAVAVSPIKSLIDIRIANFY